MKGVIFVKFAEFVEDTFGEIFWDALLTDANLPSLGAYTTVSSYDDSEIMQLIALIVERTSLTSEQTQRNFGEWLFQHLLALTPEHATLIESTFGFLQKVENLIHVEVKKLHHDAILPRFTFLERTEHTLVMRYQSQRDLCFLCEGLITGLAKHTQENIILNQSQCVHCGDDKCIIEIHKHQ